MDSVLVLLSSYNGEKFLSEQIESILRQKDVVVKILCRDDGSKDNTIGIIKYFQCSYPGSIELIEGKNKGFAMSFSELIKIGLERYPEIRYFAFADQDDVWLPEKLSVAINIISQQLTDLPVAYCSATQQVDAALRPIGLVKSREPKMFTKHNALIFNPATGCTMVFNRKAADLYAGHMPKKLIYHDYHMYQICKFLGEVIFDPTPHILYRQHSYNQIGKPTFFKRFKKRFSGNFKHRNLENQNTIFYSAYGSQLSDEDSLLFKEFINYRKSFKTRLKLIFNRKFRYSSFEPNFFFILKAIMGYL